MWLTQSVNVVAFKRRDLPEAHTVAIARTTGLYLLLIGALRRENKRFVIVTGLEYGRWHCERHEEWDHGNRTGDDFHGRASLRLKINSVQKYSWWRLRLPKTPAAECSRRATLIYRKTGSECIASPAAAGAP
jgi:hypothetical protein